MDPTPTRARPQAAAPTPTRETLLYVEVVAVEGRMIRTTGPQGELVLPVRAKAFDAGEPAPGALVRLRVGLGDGCGEYQVLGWSAVPGLPVRFGKVTTLDGDVMALQTANGPMSLRVNAFSELRDGVTTGAWVGVKVYSYEDQPTVLSARSYPGEVWDLGTLTDEGDGAFTVEGLAGPRCWKGGVGSFSKGDLLEVRGTWDPTDGFHVRAYTPKVWPQPFSGRIEARGDSKITLSDVGTLSFGSIPFQEPRRCDAACEALTVGDQVEVEWSQDVERRVIETMRPREASKIVYGELVLRTEEALTLSLPKGDRQQIRLTPTTIFASNANSGDKVDVVTDGATPPTALLVTRE